MLRILILSHQRSLNKAKAFIESWSSIHDITVVTDEPIPSNKSYVKNSHCYVVEDFIEHEIVQLVKACDFILTISENLLPLQARLETHYKLKQVSLSSAEILSNKYLYDLHCKQNGLQEFIPESVIPIDAEGFKKIQGPVILKSTIGTGGYPMFSSFNAQFEGLDYRIWKTSDDLLSYLQCHDLLDIFLKTNAAGFCLRRFNFVKAQMMLQAYIPSEVPSFTPCGFIKNGKVKICFYVRNKKVCEDEQAEVAYPQHFSKVPSGVIGDFSVTSFTVEAIKHDLHLQMHRYLQKLAQSLKIDHLFFSGPDFHLFNNKLYAIDFNPRPGHFFNLIDLENNFLFTQLFWNDNSVCNDSPVKNYRRLQWSTVRLPQGAHLTMEQIEKMSDCMSEEMQQIDFSRLPHFQFLQSPSKSLQITARGESDEDLLNNYMSTAQTLIAMAQQNSYQQKN